MLYSSILTAAIGLIASATAASLPRSFAETKAYGFPKPNDQQLLQLSQTAGGKLPGGSLPTGLDATSITTLQLIAFNELFEVAYFSSLVTNVTDEVPGYETDYKDEDLLILETIRAQEQLHAIGAIATLEANNAFAPSSCQYAVPVDTLEDSIFLAETFTAAVLGALQGAALNFAKDTSAVGLVGLVASILGQEGEQNGAYRQFLAQVPSESPFLTAVPAPFAWSALQGFVVPGSCPYPLSNVALPIFPGLTVNGGPIAALAPGNQVLSLSADLSFFADADAKPFIGGNGTGLFATFVTGQQLPYSVPVQNVQWSGNVVTLDATFPYEELVAHGFSHVSLTTSSNFTSVNDIPNDTLAAPGLIQVLREF